MIQVLFIFTAYVVIHCLMRLISILVDNELEYKITDINLIAIPSWLFQIWFWSQPLFTGVA